MRWGHLDRQGSAWAALALVLVACEPAWGSEPARVSEQQLRTVLFGSLESGSSSFATFGAKHALRGRLERSGPALMAVAGYGGRSEREGVAPNRKASFRHAIQGGLLPGYQWMIGWGAISAFAGPELDSEFVTSGESPSRTQETRLGVRLHGEAWLHPTPQTLITATAIAGSARGSLWTRGSAGYRAWRDVFVGPELSFYGAES